MASRFSRRDGARWRIVALVAFLALSLGPGGCAWFRQPVGAGGAGTAASSGGGPTARVVPPTDTLLTEASAAVGDSGAAVGEDSVGAPSTEPVLPEGEAVPGEAVQDEEDEWLLRGGGPMRATTGASGQVIEIEAPVVVHGDMTIAGLQGTYQVDRGLARFDGDVSLVNPDLTALANTAVYDRNTRILNATGNVEIQGDSLFVTAERLVYNRDENVAHLHGGVQGWQGRRQVAGREAHWDRTAGEILLLGNARVNDPDSRSWVTGDTLLYLLDREVARVTGEPLLMIRPEEGGLMRVAGDRLWLDENGTARAGGRVEVQRGLVTGTADSAAFFRNDRYAMLLGGPEVVERSGTLLGDTLYFRFDEREALTRVDVHGNAFVRYAPQDSLDAGDTSTVQGDSLNMFFVGNDPDRIVVFGNAHSTYATAGDGDPDAAGTNVADGDTITIHLENAAVNRVRVSGDARGIYTFGAASPPGAGEAADSLGAPGDSVRAIRVDARGDSARAVIQDPPAPASENAGIPGPPGVRPPPAKGTSAAADTSAGGIPLAGLGDGGPAGRERVEYKAREVEFVLSERTVDLVGSAQVDYGTLTLTAERIRFYADKRYLDAEGDPVLVEKSPGERQEIVGQRMDYSLRSREGTIDAGRTKAEDGFIYSERLRQVADGDYLAREGSFTSCDLIEHDQKPHFHFTSKRMRIYLKDKVVARPVTLYIRDIPVFALPFYVFSIRKGRHSGLLTPNFDFGLGGNGRSFDNLGYYWAASDYIDFTLATSFRERDSRFAGRLNSYYAKRYLLNGNVSYAQTLGSNETTRDITAAHEMTVGDWRVTGTAEFRDAAFRRDEPLGNDFGQRLDRLLRSDLSASRSFGFGASLSLRLNREKDLDAAPGSAGNTQIVRETLPSYSFSLNSRTLGRKPDESGDGGRLPFLSTVRWSLRSSGSTVRTENWQRTINTTVVDTLADAFSFVPLQETVLDTVDRIVSERSSSSRHTLNISDTRKIFGAINVGPSFTATENWVDREFSLEDTTRGFRRALTYNASLNASTTLYGTFPGLGPVRALRHTMSPSVSFGYQPEFGSLTYEDTLGVKRSRFPGVFASKSKRLSLALSNKFQAKVRSGDDVKRVELFNWNLNTSYDFLAEERGARPWGTVTSSVDLTRILGLGLTFNSSHDPYRQFRTLNFSGQGAFSLRGSLPGGESGVGFNPVFASGRRGDLNELGADVFRSAGAVGSAPVSDEALDWNASVSFSYSGGRIGEDLETQTSINSRFGLQITRNWSISYNNTWRVTEGEIVGESFTLRRDLHCWEATFTGSKLGDDTSFYFRINAKSLPDVKYEQGQRGSDFGGLTSFLP